MERNILTAGAWSLGPIVRLATVPASVGFGQTAVLSLIPVIASQMGLGLGTIGAAAAAGTLAFLVGAPFWGQRSRRIGRRRMLLALSALVLVSHLMLLGGLAMGTQSATAALALLVISRIVYGIGASGLMPTAQSWALDLIPPERKTRALGLLGAAGGLGRVLGSAAASLAMITPFAPFLALAASPLFIALAPADRSPGPTNASASQSAAKRSPLGRRLAPALLAGGALAFAAMQSQIALGAWLAARFGLDAEAAAAQVGSLLALAAVTMITVHGLIAAHAPKRPEPLLAVGGVGVASGAYVFTFAGSMPAFVAGSIVMAAGFAMAGLAVSAWLSGRVSSAQRPAAFGWLASAQVCGQAAGALGGGLAFEIQPTLPFLGTAVIGVAIGLSALVLLFAGRAGGEAFASNSN